MAKQYETQQRAALLSFFAAHGQERFKAGELIRSPELTLGEATVYRLLKRLTDEGLLQRFEGTGREGAEYRLARKEPDAHPHLRCVACGQTIPLDCAFLDDLAGHLAAEHAFHLDNGRTVLIGRCDRCR